jgi:hypothetical protein
LRARWFDRWGDRLDTSLGLDGRGRDGTRFTLDAQTIQRHAAIELQYWRGLELSTLKYHLQRTPQRAAFAAPSARRPEERDEERMEQHREEDEFPERGSGDRRRVTRPLRRLMR